MAYKISGNVKKTFKISGSLNDYLSEAEATGAFITLGDSVQRKLLDFELFGKSVQDGTPTPEAPVEIQSIESPKVTVCGKNLIDVSEWALTGTTLENGIFTSNINNGYYSHIATYNISLCSLLMQNLGKTITFSVDKAIQERGMSIVLYGKRSDGETYQESKSNYINNVSLTISDTFTNITQIQLRWNRNSEPFTDKTTTVKNIQLELGNAPTEYEPYQANTATLSDIVLKSAGEAEDRIFKDGGGVWKIERNIGEVDLGTLGWQIYSYSGINRFDSSKIIDIVHNDYNTDSKNLLCSNGYKGSPAPINGNSADKCIGTYRERLYVRDDSYASVDEFKEAMNGVTLYYELAAPTYETLPDSIQEELNALESYNHVTNIFTDSELAPDMRVRYTKL